MGAGWKSRALQGPDDRADLLSGGLASAGRRNSLLPSFLRCKASFFGERNWRSSLNIDFVNHVALVAVVEEGERPVDRRRRALYRRPAWEG